MAPAQWLERLSTARPRELAAVLFAFAYFFCLLCSYYILRPVRDEMGVAGGVGQLQWLFTATFVVMLIAVPIYGALVARIPRRRFVPWVSHVFAANLVLFWLALEQGFGRVEIARAFFVWISLFNLFAVSVFWSYLADLFGTEQAKRLYGFIAAGGSLGALAGPLVTIALARLLGPSGLMLLAAVLLEAAAFCARRLEGRAGDLAASREGEATAAQAQQATQQQAAVGGGGFDGFLMILRSRYLAGIALWVAALSLFGTFLYFTQANVIAAASDDPAQRTRLFATIDLVVSIATVLVQAFVTGRLIKAFGTGRALALTPVVFLGGFAALAAAPGVALVIGLQAAQRTANFALSNPARESLFAAADRAEKYKAKNIIDTVLFRGADALFGWLFAALRGAGFTLPAIALAVLPVAALWLILSLALGWMQQARSTPAPT